MLQESSEGVNARVERPYHDITLIVLAVGIAVALLWWIIF